MDTDEKVEDEDGAEAVVVRGCVFVGEQRGIFVGGDYPMVSGNSVDESGGG